MARPRVPRELDPPDPSRGTISAPRGKLFRARFRRSEAMSARKSPKTPEISPRLVVAMVQIRCQGKRKPLVRETPKGGGRPDEPPKTRRPSDPDSLRRETSDNPHDHEGVTIITRPSHEDRGMTATTTVTNKEEDEMATQTDRRNAELVLTVWGLDTDTALQECEVWERTGGLVGQQRSHDEMRAADAAVAYAEALRKIATPDGVRSGRDKGLLREAVLRDANYWAEARRIADLTVGPRHAD